MEMREKMKVIKRDGRIVDFDDTIEFYMIEK